MLRLVRLSSIESHFNSPIGGNSESNAEKGETGEVATENVRERERKNFLDALLKCLNTATGRKDLRHLITFIMKGTCPTF